MYCKHTNLFSIDDIKSRVYFLHLWTMYNYLMNSKVAIIVPVWNVNKYLYECLTSISKISIPFEAIVVDDHGQEDPWPIFSLFSNSKNFKFIKNKQNMGAGFARNIGISNISDDVSHILFVDPDDVVIFENVNSILLEPGKTFYQKEYIRFNKKNETIYKLSKPVVGTNLSTYIWGQFWDVSIFKNVKFKNAYFEDAIFAFEANKFVGENIAFTETIIYKYRIRKGSVTRRKWGHNEMNDFILMINYFNYNIGLDIKSSNYYKKWIKNQFKFLFMHSTISMWLPKYGDFPQYSKLSMFMLFIGVVFQKMFLYEKLFLKKYKHSFD